MSSTRPVALVTGASRGLGRAMALSFARHGHDVAVHYHQNDAKAKETEADIKKLSVTTRSFKADLANSKDVNQLVQDVEKDFGRIDVVVNNAGTTRNATIQKMKDDEWREVLAANLDGVFFVTRAVIPVLRKQNGGTIINVASFLAQRPSYGAANYAASKAGLIALTKAAAIEEGRNNIRVNAVMPGFHVTDMNASVWGKYKDEILKPHVLGKLTDLSEMADFIVQLAAIKTVSGQVFPFESRIL